jgi:hypothetical protein
MGQRIAAVLLAASLLGGCAGTVASPDVTDVASASVASPEPTPTPAATPSPTLSMTPTASPSPAPTPSPSPGWHVTGSMAFPRQYHAATRLANGHVLVAGGMDEGLVLQAEVYDPVSATWTATAPVLEGRYGHTLTLLDDGTVLMAGGYTVRSDASASASAELYDPATHTWTSTGDMTGVRTLHTATLLPDGRVLVAGGATYNGGNGAPIETAEIYDPTHRTWTAIRPMTEARGAHTATLLPDGTVLVTGGIGTSSEEASPTNTALASTERFDPATGRWTAGGAMDEGRAKHTATLLPDGRVFVSEGVGADLFDPRDGSWTPAELGGTSIASAVLLPAGMLMVIGFDGQGATPASEIHDPRTGSWTGAASLTLIRFGWTATLLAHGTVLVTGGNDDTSASVAQAERYQPSKPG